MDQSSACQHDPGLWGMECPTAQFQREQHVSLQLGEQDTGAVRESWWLTLLPNLHPWAACLMQAHMMRVVSNHQQALCGWPGAPVHLHPQNLQTPAGQAAAAGRQPAAGVLWVGHRVHVADDVAFDEAQALSLAAAMTAAAAAAVQNSERTCQASAQVWAGHVQTLAASVACPLAAVESLAAVGLPGSCPLAIAAAAAAAAARQVVGQDNGPASVALGCLKEPLGLMLPAGLPEDPIVAAGQKGATGCQEPQACSRPFQSCISARMGGCGPSVTCKI